MITPSRPGASSSQARARHALAWQARPAEPRRQVPRGTLDNGSAGPGWSLTAHALRVPLRHASRLPPRCPRRKRPDYERRIRISVAARRRLLAGPARLGGCWLGEEPQALLTRPNSESMKRRLRTESGLIRQARSRIGRLASRDVRRDVCWQLSHLWRDLRHLCVQEVPNDSFQLFDSCRKHIIARVRRNTRRRLRNRPGSTSSGHSSAEAGDLRLKFRDLLIPEMVNLCLQLGNPPTQLGMCARCGSTARSTSSSCSSACSEVVDLGL